MAGRDGKVAGNWTSEPAGLLRVGGFRLVDIDTSSTPGYGEDDKDAGKEFRRIGEELGELQESLYAESKACGAHRLLLVLQAMDTAGKGGIIRDVSGCRSAGRQDPRGQGAH